MDVIHPVRKIISILIIILYFFSAGPIRAAERYELVPLGTPGYNSYARGMNNIPQVVGTAVLTDTEPYISHAFLWEDGVMTDLGTLGGFNSIAYEINELGQIVGKVGISEDAEHAFLITPEDTNLDGVPDCWYRDENQDGANDLMTDLGTLGGSQSFAYSVNDAGQITGQAYTSAGWGHAFLLTPEDTNGDDIPDLWYRDDNADGANDLMADLGTLGSSMYSHGYDVNELGHVTGDAGKAFIWKNDEMTELPKPPLWHPDGSEAWGINDLDQVAGFSCRSEDVCPAVLWEEDFSTIEIGILGEGWISRAYAVNNSGQVVGYSSTDYYGGFHRGFLWDNGVLHDINDLISPPPVGLVVRYAMDINDFGEIAGYYKHTSTGKTYACLLKIKPTQFEDGVKILKERTDFEDQPQISDTEKSKQLE
jgi:probable HAF family extracellular repeat protein